ncbi:hypothetical protein GPA22_08365, partial [Aromatoleum toluvorans]|nr:hypothetical protein [Aromatoleum toluvorans]
TYAPRFLPTLGRPRAVALHFVRCDQLTVGLAPTGVRPCWAHKKTRRGPMVRDGFGARTYRFSRARDAVRSSHSRKWPRPSQP